MHAANCVDHEGRFIPFIKSGEKSDFVATATVGPKIFWWSVRVLSNNRVCSRKDVLGRTVVLLEQNRLGTNKVSFKLSDVTNVCTTKCINGLIRVSYDRQVGRAQLLSGFFIEVCVLTWQRFGQLSNQCILGVVSVLILINQNVTKALLIASTNLGKVTKKIDSFNYQIIKIKCIITHQLGLIGTVNLSNNSLARI